MELLTIGRFAELTGDLSEGVTFLQTYTFFGKQNERGQYVLKMLREKYGVKEPGDVIAPVGTAKDGAPNSPRDPASSNWPVPDYRGPLARTGLITLGSLIDYNYHVVLPPSASIAPAGC